MEAGAVNKQELSVFSTGREAAVDTEVRLLEYMDCRIVILAEEIPVSGHICPEKSKPLFRYLIRSGGRKPGAIGLRAPPFK